MPYSAAQVNALFQAVLQRPADLAAIQLYANSTTPDGQLRQQIETSQEAQVNVNPVIRLYQGTFGRLPDAAGLQANVTSYINGYNLNTLATSFLAGPEAAAVFGQANPPVTTNFVQTIYQNALNRTGSVTELAYWVGTGKSSGQVLAEISNSSEAVNKTGVATLSFLDAQATAAPALGGTGNVGVTGSLYNQVATNTAFTANNDVILGSSNADTFNASPAGVFTINVPGTFVNAGDTVNGGAGVDTLNIDVSAGPVSGVPTQMTNVEIVNLIGNQANNLNFQPVSNLQLVTVRNSTTGGDVISLKGGVLAGLDNVVASGATETFNFNGTQTFNSVAVANGTNVGTVNLNSTTGTTLNVVSTGSAGSTAGNTIGNLQNTGAAETTINISGDKALTIGAIDAGVTTVNASANTGGVTLTLGGGNVSVTGTGANDKFAFANAGDLNTFDTVVGGAGTDTISVAATDIRAVAPGATLDALNTKVSGVEVLEFTGGGAAKIDGNTFTNTEITKILFNGAGADTIDNAGSARTYAFGSGNTGDATLNLKTGTTSVSVSLEGASNSAAAIGTLQVNNAANAQAGTVPTIALNSSLTSGTSAAANTITAFDGVVPGANLNVTGAQALTIGSLTQASNINASQFTGKLTLTSGSTANDTIVLGSGGSEITTGNGADNVTVAGGTNTISVGDGDDTVVLTAGTNQVTGGGGADNLTAGSGADTFSYPLAADSVAGGFDTITGFNAAQDKIVLSGTATSLSQGATFTASGTGTLATDIQTALNAGGLSGASFQVGQAAVVDISSGSQAGKYLVFNNATAGYDSTDTVIKLANLQGTLSVANINGAGNDTFTVTAGTTFNGLGGNDVFLVGSTAALQGSTLDGGADTDTLRLTGAADIGANPNPTLLNIENLDVQTFATTIQTARFNAFTKVDGSGLITFDGNGTTATLQADSTATNFQLAAGGQAFDASANASTHVITGGTGNDTITSGTGQDTINGGNGIDVITLTADAGVRDTIQSNVALTANADLITGFVSGTDKFQYSASLITGGAVATVATGTSFADTVSQANANAAGTFIATTNVANANANGQGTAFTAVLGASAGNLTTRFETLRDALVATDGALAGAITGLDTAVTNGQTALIVLDNGTGSIVLQYTADTTNTANTIANTDLKLVGVLTNTAATVAGDFI